MVTRTGNMRRDTVLAFFFAVSLTGVLSAGVLVLQSRMAAEDARILRLRGLAEASSVLLADAAHASEDRKAFVWTALTDREPGLVAAVLIDLTGEMWFARGRANVVDGVVLAESLAVTDFDTWHAKVSVPGVPEASTLTIGALRVPPLVGGFEGGTLIIAIHDTVLPWHLTARTWLLLAGLVASAVAGAMVGASSLRRRVLGPLKVISDQMGRELEREEPLGSRADVVGRLTRAFQKMRTDARLWREQATRLEKTMDRRVNAETKRINVQLKQAQRRSWTDALTGLANRRVFDEKLPEIFEAQQRRGHDLAIVIIDIDHFKDVNDSLGHAAGDELLVFMGELLRQCLRGDDMAIRLGGDEFVLILPSTSAEDAAMVAQRTLTLFAQRAKLVPIIPKPSMSAGVASSWQSGAVSVGTLIQCADDALYEAKRQGKARVAVYEPSPASSGSL
ncbi:MAG: GGDEF domain-containing protein [Phycisphaerae bacterium]|nr:GGDEF domain-containing protein [Phycisphaerae bacterium]